VSVAAQRARQGGQRAEKLDPFVVFGLGQVLLVLEAVAFLDLIIDQGSDVSRYDLKERKRPLNNLPGLTVRSAG